MAVSDPNNYTTVGTGHENSHTYLDVTGRNHRTSHGRKLLGQLMESATVIWKLKGKRFVAIQQYVQRHPTTDPTGNKPKESTKKLTSILASIKPTQPWVHTRTKD